jgi:hypothetical protein
MTRATRPLLALVLLSLALWLPGCMSGTASVYPGPRYEPTDPHSVQVYRFFPDAPFSKIGEVQAIGATGTDWKKFQEELQNKAASIGGNAVVIVGERNQLLSVYESPSQFQTFNFQGPQSFYYPGTVYPQQETSILGIVLRFPPGEVPHPPPPGDPGAARAPPPGP